MKTLTKDNVSVFIFDDAEVLSIAEETITVGDPAKLIIGDCGSSNSVLHENVTPPEDWVGRKYLFDGTNWSLNPDWSDPTVEEELPS